MMKKKGQKAFLNKPEIIGFLVLFCFAFSSCESLPSEADSPGAQGIAEAEERSYELQAGDTLLIEVWRVPMLTQRVKVGVDGKFLYPLLGSIPAEGKTVDELRDYLIQTLGKEYLKDPNVNVVLESGTQKFYVVGEVKSPGAFNLEQKIDVYQAIIMAGGFTDFASEHVKIIRKTGRKQKVYPVDVKRLRENREVKREAYIQAGDTIVVDKSLI